MEEAWLWAWRILSYLAWDLKPLSTRSILIISRKIWTRSNLLDFRRPMKGSGLCKVRRLSRTKLRAWAAPIGTLGTSRSKILYPLQEAIGTVQKINPSVCRRATGAIGEVISIRTVTIPYNQDPWTNTLWSVHLASRWRTSSSTSRTQLEQETAAVRLTRDQKLRIYCSLQRVWLRKGSSVKTTIELQYRPELLGLILG